MHFAILGDHPDGVDLARALVQSGRHRLLVSTVRLEEPGQTPPREHWSSQTRRVSDVEEILADPVVEAVIVAGAPTVRPAQLRRALQSERHVLCVYPPDQTPEIAYEAAMIRNDTGRVLLPILPEATHPALRRLAEFVQRKNGSKSPIGIFRLLEMERGVSGEVLDGVGIAGHKSSFPGWDVLRTIGGEIQEVMAFAESEELREGEPVLLAGRFQQGGLFHATLLPRRQQSSWRLSAIGSTGRVELYFPLGWHGPAYLDWRGSDGEPHEEYWPYWDPWPALIETFEAMVASETPQGRRLSWQDAIRGLELDDAARRGVERRRASVLEYPEATEEVGFKGTMTLVGCATLWGVLLLLILSVGWPRLGFLIVPLIVGFLGLQVLRYLVPKQGEK
jgi:predicted dehydrogenase